MIEFETARSGHRVLKKNGKLLASAFDPLREASAWVDKFGMTGTADETLVVIGVGSGYHIAELVSRNPKRKILAIESDHELVRRAKEICPSLSEVETVVEPEWTRLVEHAELQDGISGIYHIAVHGPSFQIEHEYFAAVDRLLRGRDKLSFLLLLKTRPEFLPLLDAKAVGEIGDEAISVKTLGRIFSPMAGASRERRIWQLLEELVV